MRKLRDIGFAPPKVDFVACDYPFADKMQIQLLAVFAEHERDMIAKRTSERLQALKASGRPWMSRKSGRLVERLGSPDPSKGSAAGCEARRSKADEFAAKMLPIIDAMRARGHHDAGRHRRRAHAAEMADGSQCRELVDDGGVEHLEAGAL